MNRALWIGDMHLRLSDLSEAGSIVDQILSIIDAEKPSHVILSGDQFDTFGVVRSEILAHWTRFFVEASKRPFITEIIALVGNHDMSGADGGVSAMEPFKHYENVKVVDASYDLGTFYFVPFMRDTAQFEAYCRSLPAGSILFCHQSFNGAQFENGFYDPHGADPACATHLMAVISGHVHKAQQIANIWYPGTPRQLTFSDAGEPKYVYTLSLSSQGYTIENRHKLNVPTYSVIETETVPELIGQVELTLKAAKDLQMPLSDHNIKLIARGAPSEIAEFWLNESVKELKAKAKRVVDALTSVKPVTAFVQVAGRTQSEKLDEYIQSRKWRTSADQLAERAREFLAP